MTNKLVHLNQERKKEYFKDPDEENFLQNVNKNLLGLERSLYRNVDIQYPFLFIFGLPRSGTTLLSQLLAHSLDVGFINNFMARFWISPVCGIRLAKSILKHETFRGFKSDYGATLDLSDIHEFGYFWRKWLKKETLESVKNAPLNESEIDWDGLKHVLANIQLEFAKPMIFKNIYGSYHLQKMKEVLGQVLYVYIERDPLDTAVSILNARKKYYHDLNKWWSYAPPEVMDLIKMDYWHQITGQIHYLKKFYYSEMDKLDDSLVVRIKYKELCHQPKMILNRIRERSNNLYGNYPGIVSNPPEEFPYRVHEEPEIKEKFKKLLTEFEQNE